MTVEERLDQLEAEVKRLGEVVDGVVKDHEGWTRDDLSRKVGVLQEQLKSLGNKTGNGTTVETFE